MSSQAPSKKRKRDSGIEADTIFKLAEALPSGSGPVLGQLSNTAKHVEE
jgi:hypothetical protein